MSWFKRKDIKDENIDSTDDFVYDQAVILDINLTDDTHTDDEFYNDIHALEDDIETKLPKKSGIDGDEFGDDGATMYIYGPDAKAIFAAIKSCLAKSNFKDINVTLQFGLPDDPNTTDEKFRI